MFNLMGNISKINLKTIKYNLKYKQKSSNKINTHKKSSNEQHSTHIYIHNIQNIVTITVGSGLNMKGLISGCGYSCCFRGNA